MQATLVQVITEEVAGYLDRRVVVGAIARVRQRIERELGGCVMPRAISDLLIDLCQAMELSQFEIIEIMGSTWSADRAWETLTPVELPAEEYCAWVDAHAGKVIGEVILR